ncbi:MAG: hypothetical protein AMS17_20780, partial [Spirochaetes bacterium DG_61]
MQLKSIDSYKMIESGIELSSGNVLIRIALVEKNILRIWSTVQDDFHPTETFVLDKNEFLSIPIQIEDRSDYIRLSGGELTVEIYLDPFWIDIRDSSKSSFLSTPAGESLEWNG